MGAELVQRLSRLGLTVPRVSDKPRPCEECGWRHRGRGCGPHSADGEDRTAEYGVWNRDTNLARIGRPARPPKRFDRRSHVPRSDAQEMALLVWGRAYTTRDGERIQGPDDVPREFLGRHIPVDDWDPDEERSPWRYDERSLALQAAMFLALEAVDLTEQQRLALLNVRPAFGDGRVGGLGTMTQREAEEKFHWPRGTAQQALRNAQKKVRTEVLRRHGTPG